jgi:hypothetical protein
MLRTRPSFSPFGPALKKSVGTFLPFAALVVPNSKAQSPSITIGVPPESDKVPRKAPVLILKALMVPSPKLPTSRAWLNVPKFAGALAMPHGEFSGPCDNSRRMNFPLALKTST